MSRVWVVALIAVALGCDSHVGRKEGAVPVIGGATVEIGGAAEGSVEFGEVQDVAFLPGGDLLVLDRMNTEVVRFGQTGGIVGRLGSEGEGPGEWLWPSTVDVSASGTVRVMSQGLSRIHVYEALGSEFRLRDETRLPYLPRDLCTLRERVFVLGLKDGRTVHEIGSDGRVMASFGVPIERPPELLGPWDAATAEWTADGRLVCDDAKGLVIHVPMRLPDVTAYDASGQVVWRIRLNGWSQGRWERAPGGPIHAAPDPATGLSSGVVSAVLLSPDQIVVQFLNTGRPGYAGAEREVVSQVLDASTGAPCGSSRDLPRLWAVMESRAAWAMESVVPGVALGRIEGGACLDQPSLRNGGAQR